MLVNSINVLVFCILNHKNYFLQIHQQEFSMKRLLIPIHIFALLTIACGDTTSNSGQGDPSTVIPETYAIHTEEAYIKLVDFTFTDESGGQYGKSDDKRQLKINGETNFPDGTIIKVNTSGFVPSTREQDIYDTYGDAVPAEGKFSITLKPWNVTQYIEFRVFKKDQPKALLEAFGEDGSRIKIKEYNRGEFPSICFFKSDSILVNNELIASMLSGKPISYKFQRAGKLRKPYEKKLAEFVWAWKQQDWNAMLKHTQQSQKETSESLRSMFDVVQIVGFEIDDSDESGGGLVKVNYTAYIKPSLAHKGITRKSLTANVIKEAEGWGVNATSVTGNLY